MKIILTSLAVLISLQRYDEKNNTLPRSWTTAVSALVIAHESGIFFGGDMSEKQFKHGYYGYTRHKGKHHCNKRKKQNHKLTVLQQLGL